MAKYGNRRVVMSRLRCARVGGRRQPVATTGDRGLPGSAPSITTIERRGIEHVPAQDRWGRPNALFWMWAGAVWNVEYVYYGAIAVVFLGLSFAQAVIVVLHGNLSHRMIGVASKQGPRRRTSTCVSKHTAL